MIEMKQAEELGNGLVDVATETKKVCASCGYDLDEAELKADKCADCGAPLNLSVSVSLHATSVPTFIIPF